MPLILGTNSIKDTGYNVANSLRFNSGSSDYLNRTPSSAGNRKTFTISLWFKVSEISTSNINLIASGSYPPYQNDLNTELQIRDHRIKLVGGASNILESSAFIRDPSAWFHLVIAIDTTQGTSSNRVKMYINGVLQTSLNLANYPSQNDNYAFNNNVEHRIGRSAGTNYFPGYMAEFVMIDGQQLDPTSFGEFDEDSGIWKPIDVSGLTFGTNGFYLDFENSGSLGADVSGNGNNFTVNNLTSVDQSSDSCTNNFATLNPLAGSSERLLSFSNGNTTSTSTSSLWESNPTTIGASQGKWYAEYKYVSTSSGQLMPGVIDLDTYMNDANRYGGVFNRGYAYDSNNGNKVNNDVSSSYGNSYAVGDIIGVAMDLDNHKIYFSKNGTWQNSGDPTSGSTGTGSAFNLATGYTYGFMASNKNSVHSWNFGNPPFTISSGNSDANGYGNFEYAVPSGYYSLCTKNLAEYG